jgi:hypothetical protein
MSIATALNFSPTTPAPPSGQQNIVGQNDGGAPTANQSFYDPPMEGDTGSGGSAGNVPAPAAGDAAAGKFLKADGTWSTAPGAGTYFKEVVSFSGTAGTLSHVPLAGMPFVLVRNYQEMSDLSGCAAVQTFLLSGAAVTLAVGAGGSDVFIARYYY